MSKIGRPKLKENEKKQCIAFTIDKDLLNDMETIYNSLRFKTRTDFITTCIKKEIKKQFRKLEKDK